MNLPGPSLSIDPSLRCTGIVCWRANGTVVTARTVRTEKESKKRRIYVGDDDCRRLAMLENVLKALMLEGYRFAIAEQPAGSQSYRGAKAEGMMLGVLTGVFGLAVRWVQARDVKKAATGRYKAEKNEMVEWAKLHYPETMALQKTKPEREAIADALATMIAFGG